MPQPGDIIAGKYTIARVIGEGGMGIVYEATHLRLRQRVAIKMLLPTMLEHDVIVQRFEREARAAAGLKGRHAAHVVDVDQTPDGLPYMVMEYLDGHDLQREIERRGALPPGEAVDYVLQACAAMAEAHQLGIIHRDLKPSNLFLVHEGESRIVKVLDFGISKVQAEGDTKLTGTDVMMGTALYMSPEQIRASSDVDARADVWALGVILYECLAGRAPFVGSATQVAAAIVTQDATDIRKLAMVPADLANVMQRAMMRDRGLRYPTIRELAVALAPHATPGSPGKFYADTLLTSSPRISVPEITGRFAAKGTGSSADHAPTILHASTVSESRMRDGGTAPGWSQAGVVPRRGRAALFGFLGAFLFALALALVVILVRAKVHPDPSAGAVAASPPASVASVEREPAPPTAPEPPAAPMAAPAVAPAAPASAAAPVALKKPSAPVAAPARPPAAPPPPPPKPAAAPSPPAKPGNGGNPLLL